MRITYQRILIAVAGVAFVGCSGGLSTSKRPASDGGVSVEPILAATIHVTRSTNSPAIEVAVFSDGSAERTLGAPGFNNTAGVAPRSYEAGSPEVMLFLADLNSVGDVSAIPILSTCPKSISFGTKTTVTALSKSSGDLQCLDQPSAAQAALASDCRILAGPP